MKHYYSFLILLLLSTVLLPAQDRTGKDIAVFFPVETYRGKWKTLYNPLKEANEISKILHEQYGIQTEIHKNKTLPEILEVLANLLNKKYPEDGQLLIFFSGHGAFNDMTKEGFFIPANASEEHEYLNYETLRKKTDAIPCNHTLLMIDACYSGTFDDAVAYKGEPDEWEEKDLASRIEKELKFKTRYFAASGAKERTPDQSQFAARFIQALRFPPKDGVASLGSIGMEIEKATPKPYMKPFGSDQRGNFLFISSNRREPENPKTTLYNQIKPDCDKDFNLGNWGDAKYCYKLLLNYQPEDAYALSKIKECESHLASSGEENAEKKYQTALANARFYRDKAQEAERKNDCVAEKENWEKAKPYYQECLGYKSNDAIGLEGVAQCDKEIKTLDCDPDKDGFEGNADKCPDKYGKNQGCPENKPADQPDFVPMVYVQGGTFTMGCTAEQGSDCDNDEKPAHTVTVGNYWIGKYEVTQSEWREIMGSNPSSNSGCDNCPVEQVSWDDIQDFLRTLNQRYPGRNYRLPTEAEWEYAARGGNRKDGTQYAGSSSMDNLGWYSANSGNKTHPVGQKSANGLGIYDMSGNVWEWCSDWYGSYSSGSQTNPTGATSGSNRVNRGGSWYYDARYCRISIRDSSSPSYGSVGIGFRLSRTE